MRKIVLSVPDDMAQMIEEWAERIPEIEVVCNKESLGRRVDGIDQRMSFVFKKLKTDGVLQHLYDYAWIMVAICDGMIEGIGGFRSAQSFMDYLKGLGISPIPSRSTLNTFSRRVVGRYPKWEFADTDDAFETNRRKGVVKHLIQVLKEFSE